MENSITNKQLSEKYPLLSSIINFHYPIGIKKENPVYNNFIGTKILKNIILDNILNNDVFISKWEKDFLGKLEKKINHKIIGATNGLVPNIGGFIIIYQSNDLRFQHQLHLYTSLINNYYSIQFVIIDKFMQYDKDIVGWGIKELVVSPVEGCHKELFLEIENYIRERFPDAKFLPYSIDKLKLQGLQVGYIDDEDCEIGQAFFCKVIPFGNPEKVIGDSNYRINELD